MVLPQPRMGIHAAMTEKTAGDLGDRRDVRTVVEIEALADEVEIGGVGRGCGFAPEACEAADDVIERAPTEEECAIAAGRKPGLMHCQPSLMDCDCQMPLEPALASMRRRPAGSI